MQPLTGALPSSPRCATPADVAAALRFARDEALVVAVRGGGHSYPGFSTCDDGVVIDLGLMQEVTVDPDRRVATVQAGALLKGLDTAAQRYGLVCPVGAVSHTGVAGLTLGGGLGRLMRRFGLTIDNLIDVEFVSAEGRHLRASDDEHPELFWGLRGAGANWALMLVRRPFSGARSERWIAGNTRSGRLFSAAPGLRSTRLAQGGRDAVQARRGWEDSSEGYSYPAEALEDKGWRRRE